jgi:hypothetical protein
LTLKSGVTTRTPAKDRFVETLATHITSGLSTGQRVVPADLSTALSTNTTNARPRDVLEGQLADSVAQESQARDVPGHGHRPDPHPGGWNG